MDIQAIWLIVIAVSAPIGAVVAFFVQVRQLRKIQLENQRLELEMKELRTRLAKAENVIVTATPDEIARYGAALKPPAFNQSRPWRGVNPGPDDEYSRPAASVSGIWGVIMGGLFVGLVLCFLAYLLYDVYRVGGWLLNLFFG